MTHTETIIELSEQAKAKILQTAVSENIDMTASRLRIAVVPGGCSGLTYDLGWDTSVTEKDATDVIDGIPFVIDARSAAYLSGSRLDFSDGLEGKGFHFHNPQAVRNCACGESFGL